MAPLRLSRPACSLFFLPLAGVRNVIAEGLQVRPRGATLGLPLSSGVHDPADVAGQAPKGTESAVVEVG